MCIEQNLECNLEGRAWIMSTAVNTVVHSTYRKLFVSIQYLTVSDDNNRAGKWEMTSPKKKYESVLFI